MSLLTADREAEFELFNQILTGHFKERILLIKAPGGRGKSTLLKAFMDRCAAIPHVPVDLKGQTVGLHDIFYQIGDTLGWGHFSNFATAVGQLAQVNISRNVLIGWSTIQVALQAGDESNRQNRRAILTQALFNDLRILPQPPVLIFDTFEGASPEVGEWFSHAFLPGAYRSPGLVVVVAGREVPLETIAWRCHLHVLPPIEDHQLWYDFCQQAGLGVHVEGVKVLCTLFKGHPDEIVKALTAVAGQGGQL
jgi:hypothetical protein